MGNLVLKPARQRESTFDMWQSRPNSTTRTHRHTSCRGATLTEQRNTLQKRIQLGRSAVEPRYSECNSSGMHHHLQRNSRSATPTITSILSLMLPMQTCWPPTNPRSPTFPRCVPHGHLPTRCGTAPILLNLIRHPHHSPKQPSIQFRMPYRCATYKHDTPVKIRVLSHQHVTLPPAQEEPEEGDSSVGLLELLSQSSARRFDGIHSAHTSLSRQRQLGKDAVVSPSPSIRTEAQHHVQVDFHPAHFSDERARSIAGSVVRNGSRAQRWTPCDPDVMSVRVRLRRDARPHRGDCFGPFACHPLRSWCVETSACLQLRC